MKTTTKKIIAKKPVMKKGGVKKKLPIAQKGKTTGNKTPFQNYMSTTPGATPSDTTQTFTGSRDGSNPALDKAYYETYYAGQSNKRRTGSSAVKYDSKGNRIQAKGGSTKCAKCGGKTMKEGGFVGKIKKVISQPKKRK